MCVRVGGVSVCVRESVCECVREVWGGGEVCVVCVYGVGIWGGYVWCACGWTCPSVYVRERECVFVCGDLVAAPDDLKKECLPVKRFRPSRDVSVGSPQRVGSRREESGVPTMGVSSTPTKEGLGRRGDDNLTPGAKKGPTMPRHLRRKNSVRPISITAVKECTLVPPPPRGHPTS